ncbi:MAG TPA: hypothetical protein VGT99_05865 [Gammaproteobacteria bacterium]|nr:hypothetical protein [Gammaproteobacteria bacterium]
MAKTNASDAKGTLFVCDIDKATCAFCPVGTEFAKGDKIHIHDEKTVFGRQIREKLVEITAVKVFRSTGRQITLDLMMISEAECQKIAEDSDLTVDVLMKHKVGAEKYDPSNPPVVIFFTPV